MKRVVVAAFALALLAGCTSLPHAGGGARSGPDAGMGRAGGERLDMRADGLHWTAALTFLPAPGGQSALLYTLELRYLVGPKPDRYRVTVSLPYAAQVCRREDSFVGSEVAGPWTSSVGPGAGRAVTEAGGPSEGAGTPLAIRPAACRLELDGRPVAAGLALVAKNPLTLQVEWQTGSEIHVEILSAHPAATSR